MDVGRVYWSVYKHLFSFSTGGIKGLILVVVLSILINLCTIAVSMYLAFTLSHKFHAETKLISAEELTAEKLEAYGHDNKVLFCIVLLSLTSSFVGKYLSNKIFMSINKNLHDCITEKIINTDLKFFEENPHGRIVNRFSKDIATLDRIVFLFLEMMDYSVKCVISVLIVVYICPWILIFAFGSLWYMIKLRTINLKSTRDPIRLKYTLTSPINSLI
jgi:ABC-type multidrug transport system fused ATPase/permease subunit